METGEAIVVYGAGGHGRAVVELIARAGGFRLVGVLDDAVSPGNPVLDTSVIGGGDRLEMLRDQGVGLAANAVGGIGRIESRVAVTERLVGAGFRCPNLVHPAATVEPTAQVGTGIQLFAHTYVGTAARVADGVIVNTAAVISHDCEVGEHANLSPGALLAGGVRVGARCLVGMGATVNLDLVIGAGARIGNSAVVKADVPAGGVVRAGHIWPA